jgi:hypothetical protein
MTSRAPRIVSFASSASFSNESPRNKLSSCLFDNVCSALRKSAWVSFPFRRTKIAEDVEWAREVLLAGYSLAYAPDACVFHSHERSPLYEFNRTFATHRELHRLFGLRLIPKPSDLARAIACTVPSHLHTSYQSNESLPEMLRAAALGVSWPLGQFLGGLAAAVGLHHGHPGGV